MTSARFTKECREELEKVGEGGDRDVALWPLVKARWRDVDGGIDAGWWECWFCNTYKKNVFHCTERAAIT
jgi:hypothetical protein